jgi:hypothetical protein
VSNPGPRRQIKLRDQQQQRDREGYSADAWQGLAAPDRDCEEHATHPEQEQADGERGCCHGAETDGIDQVQQVERHAGLHLARQDVQCEVFCAVIGEREPRPEPDEHSPDEAQTKSPMSLS